MLVSSLDMLICRSLLPSQMFWIVAKYISYSEKIAFLFCSLKKKGSIIDRVSSTFPSIVRTSKLARLQLSMLTPTVFGTLSSSRLL